jgi:hypothetical protein
MTKKKVLLIGIDPKLIDSGLADTTGWDASRVLAAAQDASKRLMDLGYQVKVVSLTLERLLKTLSQTYFQGKDLTALWLVLALGHCRRIPFCLRK